MQLPISIGSLIRIKDTGDYGDSLIKHRHPEMIGQIVEAELVTYNRISDVWDVWFLVPKLGYKLWMPVSCAEVMYEAE